MGHILGPESHVLFPTLVGLLLAITMEVWNRERGPFWPNFAVFAILGQVENDISPWGRRPSQTELVILVS